MAEVGNAVSAGQATKKVPGPDALTRRERIRKLLIDDHHAQRPNCGRRFFLGPLSNRGSGHRGHWHPFLCPLSSYVWLASEDWPPVSSVVYLGTQIGTTPTLPPEAGQWQKSHRKFPARGSCLRLRC